MTVVRWMPRRDVQGMQQEINRMFNSFFGPDRDDEFVAAFAPRLDVIEDKERYVVKLDLPGTRKEDVKITLTENVLTVRGERIEEAKQDGESYHILERRFGKFSRSLTLPTNVDSTRIDARMTDGVLIIALPKAEDSKPREINIQTN